MARASHSTRGARRADVPRAVRRRGRRPGRESCSRSTSTGCSRASRCAARPAISPTVPTRRSPTCPHDDEQLARVVADLVARAGRAGPVSATSSSTRGWCSSSQASTARFAAPSQRAGRCGRAGARARGGDGGAPDGLRAARKSGPTAPVAGRSATRRRDAQPIGAIPLPERLRKLGANRGEHRRPDAGERPRHAPGRSP